MAGLDGRHRDENGRIEKKHGNTKIKNLKGEYPELKNFRNEDTLGKVLGCAHMNWPHRDHLIWPQL
jgi:hypothetical protein